MLAKLLAVLFVFSFSQASTIDCNYTLNSEVYSCELSNLRIAESEFNNITVSGRHLSGKSNSDVTRVTLHASEVPFIITQIFEAFSNLQLLVIQGSGLRHIRSNDFKDAGNLDRLIIRQNPITSLPAAAFAGASHVSWLELTNNSISTLDENAFVGLNRLSALFINMNRIGSLPTNLFRPLIRLATIFLSFNNLSRLHRRTFAHNQIMHQVSFEGNPINAIERRFLDSIREVRIANFIENRCVNQLFLFTTVDVMREGLSNCFDNYETSN
jgi:Leucine-rich repeat (LRR) protein